MMDSTTYPNPQTRTLELTVLSLDELREQWKPATERLYVVVQPESINSYATGTATDAGGGKPTWNEKLEVDLPVHGRSITLEVKCKNSPGVKDVGIARIAVSDFLGGAGDEASDQCLKFLSYTLRDWEGRRGGVLNFSVKVKAPPPPLPPPPPPEESSSGGVVIGVPVWWNNDTNRNV